jgi:hypothetical protein
MSAAVLDCWTCTSLIRPGRARSTLVCRCFRVRMPVDAGRFVQATANTDNLFEPGRIDETALDIVQGMGCAERRRHLRIRNVDAVDCSSSIETLCHKEHVGILVKSQRSHIRLT